MVEPKKPKKATQFPLQIGGVFKIHDKDPAPPAPMVTHPIKREKKLTEAPARVAWVLKLVDDEDDLEAGKPAKATSIPVPRAPTLGEASKVEVIKVPLARKMTLKKVADAAASEAVPAVVVNVANFLANRRK